MEGEEVDASEAEGGVSVKEDEEVESNGHDREACEGGL